jgi:polysaccharide export outer membrane protein
MKASRSLLRLLGILALSVATLACAGLAADVHEGAPRLDDKKVIPYRLTRGDSVSVQIFGEPDLTVGNKRIEARGTINLALIGDIRIYGMTVSEAADTIATAYRDGRILRHPQVTVSVDSYAARVVNVMGKVKVPQRVDLPPEQQWTVKDVIMKCGGFDDTARGTAVRLTRTMPDGTSKVYVLDVQSAILGKDRAETSKDASFVVEPDDVIYVPEKII